VVGEQDIYRAALELIDEKGEAAFTLSAVAARLGIRAPSLYTHVDGKRTIIEGVRDLVVSRIDADVFTTLPWPDALRAWGRSYLRAFAAHPQTIRLLATTPVRAPALIAQYEAAARALLAAGWPEGEVMHVITGVESYVLGSALDVTAPAAMVDPQPEGFPTLDRVLRVQQAIPDRAFVSFDLGLRALVAGYVDRLREVG
jgi:AcrR family transcriptional regulator